MVSLGPVAHDPHFLHKLRNMRDGYRSQQIVDAFLTALRDGDFEALVAVLDPDVLLRDDSAGLPGGAAVMRGARAVGAHALGFSRSAQFVVPALVNGAVGLAIVPQGRLMGALGFTFAVRMSRNAPKGGGDSS